jgi:RNA polymerase sigma-70 factor (ECF subfamily)
MSVSLEMVPATLTREHRLGVPMEGLDFSLVFREFGPFVWRVLARFGVPSSELPDVSQETFMVILRKLDEFRGDSSLRTWIFGICFRTASDYRRRAHVRCEAVVEQMPDPTTSETQLATVVARQALCRLDAALRELDDDKRFIFIAYELEELSMQEAALAAGCPLKTAYGRLHAARKHVEDTFRRGALLP